MKVAVIAFGTRGDVQPLAILAGGIASRSSWCSETVLVTHDAHRAWCTTMAGQIDVVGVDSPPVLWKGTAGCHAAEARANLAQQNGCIAACQGAGLVIFNMFALEGYHVGEALNIPSVVCHPYLTATAMPSAFPRRMRRVYPRLFRRLTAGGAPCTAGRDGGGNDEAETRRNRGEEAWSHVEHWMWPLFSDRWGEFRERLGLRPCPFQNDEEAESFNIGTPSSSEADVGTVDARKAGDYFNLPLVLYLFSPLVVDASPYWPKSVRICGYVFPPMATTTHTKRCHDGRGSLNDAEVWVVASTAQRHQLDQAPSDSSNQPKEATTQTEESGEPSEEPDDLATDVEAFLSSREDRPIFVGFGSMWGMCVPGYPLAFVLRVLLVAARQVGVRCLINLPDLPQREDTSLQDGDKKGVAGTKEGRLRQLEIATEWVLGELAVSRVQGDVLVHHGPLAHASLFPRCSLAVHHGGSGTTAAVLRAGIPHVICPQHLDQFFWAERIQYLAVGSVLERSLFIGLDSTSTSTSIQPPGPLLRRAEAAISSALSPQVKLRAACLGVKVRAENGLGNALASLSLFVRSRRPEVLKASQARGRATGTGCDTGVACTSTAHSIPTSKYVRVERDEAVEANIRNQGEHSTAGESQASRAGVSERSPREGNGDRDDPRLGTDGSEENLVLREMPNGLRLWWSSRAEEEAYFIFGEVFDDRTYARMGIRVQDGDTVWDVGANVGIASIFFELETDTPDSLDMYAFEPLPLNAEALRRNLSAYCPKAVILEYALGAEHQDGVLATFYPRMPGNSTLRPSEKESLQRRKGSAREGGTSSALELPAAGPAATFFDDAQQVACSVRSVSWAMATLGVNKIDLLKIDVEGGELDVLLGIDEQDWPKIRQVVTEVHPVRDRVSRACKLLRDQGFHVTKQALGLDGTPVSPSRPFRKADAGREDIALPMLPMLPMSLRTMKMYPRGEPKVEGRSRPLEHPADEKCLLNDIQRDRVDGRSDGTRDDDNVAGLAANTIAADCDPADEQSRWQEDDAARDGVVFMVYARRL